VLELEYSSSSLRILVRDDGRGIDPQFLRSGRPGHWGLSECVNGPNELGAACVFGALSARAPKLNYRYRAMLPSRINPGASFHG